MISDSGMGYFFEPWHILILLFAASFFLIPVIFYILTLQTALRKCAPISRKIDPGMVWLSIIPFVNLIANFFIVFGMAKSLRNEFNRRGVQVPDPTPGQSIGLAMCICGCCVVIPIVGLLGHVASVVLWIIYWVKIAEFSRLLDIPPQLAAPVSGV